MAYFITFSCYGTRLHGDARGSVDRWRNGYGEPSAKPDQGRLSDARSRLAVPPYHLDWRRRALVLRGIRKACVKRQWRLLAAHVRTEHVHVVVEALTEPELLMTALKAYASRELNLARIDPLKRRRWTRHGSTIYLWKDSDVGAALQYVVEGQGEPMAVYSE